jgi:glycosyltransferase involved in cell wall biosynthesis
MTILINTPSISLPAGVANHYFGLKPYFSGKVIYNQYYTRFYVRKIVNNKFMQKIAIPIAFVFNYIKFIFLLIYYNRPTVLLNPSFGQTALQRDAQFLRIAKFFGCKVAVFMHGWDKIYLQNYFTGKKQLHNAYYKADAFFVLANEFKTYLEQLNIKAPIHLTTTKVNDQLLEGVPTKTIKKIKTILFLARVEKAKGIFTTIETFQIISQRHPEIRLQVVGRGNSLNEAKEYTKSKNITNINFTGPLSGDALRNEFLKADLYILPTTHGEGMPTSVLEAMAFGLPVISRPVGGLVDFFENDKMGFMIESLDPEDYVEKVELLINDVDKANQISRHNAKYAREHFMASKIAPEIEEILNKL